MGIYKLFSSHENVYFACFFLRMSITDICKIKGVGDVICGPVLQGSIKTGETLKISPVIGCEVKVGSIETYHCPLENVRPGHQIGINVRGMQKNHKKKLCAGMVTINSTFFYPEKVDRGQRALPGPSRAQGQNFATVLEGPVRVFLGHEPNPRDSGNIS